MNWKLALSQKYLLADQVINWPNLISCFSSTYDVSYFTNNTASLYVRCFTKYENNLQHCYAKSQKQFYRFPDKNNLSTTVSINDIRLFVIVINLFPIRHIWLNFKTELTFSCLQCRLEPSYWHLCVTVMFPTSLLTEYQRINLSLLFHKYWINKYIVIQVIDYIDGRPGCRSKFFKSYHLWITFIPF